MPAGNRDFRHFILGLLSQQPMSGYDIKQYLECLGWLVGNPSFGAIYPALHALLEDGLVTLEIVAYENKPPRKIYSITASRQARSRRVDPPTPALGRLDQGLCDAPPLGHAPEPRRVDGPPAAATPASPRTTSGARTNHRRNRSPVRHGQRLAFDYGMTVANTELTWLEDLIAALETQYAPKELVGKGK